MQCNIIIYFLNLNSHQPLIIKIPKKIILKLDLSTYRSYKSNKLSARERCFHLLPSLDLTVYCLPK